MLEILLSAVLGLVVTVLAGQEPGLVLAVFLLAATAAAALLVRRESVHVIIPVPALAYLAAAFAAGFWHDPAAGQSGTALAAEALQWVASGFIGMSVATFIAIVATLLRRPKRRRAGRGNGTGDSLRRAW